MSHQINPEDVPGDEGAIFSLIVRDETILPETLARLQTEDDTVTVTLNNQNVQIEQAQVGVNPAFDLIGLTDLRNDPNFAGIDGTGFDVVVIDSGLDQTHPLLDDNYRFGNDFFENDSDPNDLNGHGTHVSGIIGAEDENIGVAPDVGLIGYKVAEETEVNGLLVILALQEVLDEVNDPNSQSNIAAVNLSLGGGSFTTPNQPSSNFDNQVFQLIQDLEAAGVVVVAAAGNEYIGKSNSEGELLDSTGNLLDPNQEQNINSPAIYSTIAVGAVWQNNVDLFGDYTNLQIPGEDRAAIFSQRLDVDNFLFAPGVYINSTVPQKTDGDLFDVIQGTSQASPHVAGAVALLQEIAASYDARLSPEQVRDYLINNANIIEDGDDEEDLVVNTGISYPRINIHQSAIALRTDLENNSFTPESPAAILDIDSNQLIDNIASNDIDGTIDLVTDNASLPTDSFRGSIGFDGEIEVGDQDVDFYRINSSVGGIVEIDIDSVSDGNILDPVDSLILLYDESGNLLGFNDDTDTLDSRLSFRVEGNTNYYAGISDYNNQDLDPFLSGDGSGGDTGEYTLNSRLLSLDVETDISNNTINSNLGRNIVLDNPITERIGEDDGYIIGSTDVDLYRFVPASDGTVSIRVDATQEFDADTFLRFFDPNGTEIAFNDDENSSTRGSFLEVEVSGGTGYYIGVNGYSEESRNYSAVNGVGAASGSQGNYTLTVSNVSTSNSSSTSTDLDLIEDDSELAIYRFFRADAGVHFYTADLSERDFILENLANFTFEGASYQSVNPTSSSSGSTPVYRFLNQNTGVHLYTTSETERNVVQELDNFSFEGEVFSAYTPEVGLDVEGTIPIYRFFNTNTGAHFYTPSVAERDNVEDNLSDFQSEGIAYYAFPIDITEI